MLALSIQKCGCLRTEVMVLLLGLCLMVLITLRFPLVDLGSEFVVVSSDFVVHRFVLSKDLKRLLGDVVVVVVVVSQ
jgi:hypothetical protein